jgi:hypothetical protein
MTTTERPDTFTISTRRACMEGARYLDQFIGHPAVFTTWAGEHRVGVVESFHQNFYPVIRFADGTWASGDVDSLIQRRVV